MGAEAMTTPSKYDELVKRLTPEERATIKHHLKIATVDEEGDFGNSYERPDSRCRRGFRLIEELEAEAREAADAIERLQRELDELRLLPARIGGARIGPGVSFGYNDGFTEGEAHGRKQAEAALSTIKKEMDALQAHHNAATAQIDYMRDQLSTARASGAEEMREMAAGYHDEQCRHFEDEAAKRTEDEALLFEDAGQSARAHAANIRALPLPAPSPVPTQAGEAWVERMADAVSTSDWVQAGYTYEGAPDAVAQKARRRIVQAVALAVLPTASQGDGT